MVVLVLVQVVVSAGLLLLVGLDCTRFTPVSVEATGLIAPIPEVVVPASFQATTRYW